MKLTASAVLFASAPVLSLQAQRGNGTVVYDGAVQGLKSLDKQNFLQDISRNKYIPTGLSKVLAYIGIGAIILFLVYWAICIDNNLHLSGKYKSKLDDSEYTTKNSVKYCKNGMKIIQNCEKLKCDLSEVENDLKKAESELKKRKVLQTL